MQKRRRDDAAGAGRADDDADWPCAICSGTHFLDLSRALVLSNVDSYTFGDIRQCDDAHIICKTWYVSNRYRAMCISDPLAPSLHTHALERLYARNRGDVPCITGELCRGSYSPGDLAALMTPYQTELVQSRDARRVAFLTLAFVDDYAGGQTSRTCRGPLHCHVYILRHVCKYTRRLRVSPEL